jgi:chemotaxis protein CheD
VSGTSALQRPTTAGGDEHFHAATGRRFYDATSAAWMIKVFPGEYYVTTKADEVLVTILGSCVSACIRDPKIGVGGMNHFMLPQSNGRNWGDDPKSTRYGNFAMEKLLNELLKAGCARDRLEIKVFGGGNVIDSTNAIGSENSDFVLRYLDAEGLRCAAQDLKGQQPRRIHYFPATGKVVRRLLGTGETSAIAREETEYVSRISTRQTYGEVDLFK